MINNISIVTEIASYFIVLMYLLRCWDAPDQA
jgi:hypothetical protein